MPVGRSSPGMEPPSGRPGAGIGRGDIIVRNSCSFLEVNRALLVCYLCYLCDGMEFMPVRGDSGKQGTTYQLYEAFKRSRLAQHEARALVLAGKLIFPFVQRIDRQRTPRAVTVTHTRAYPVHDTEWCYGAA